MNRIVNVLWKNCCAEAAGDVPVVLLSPLVQSAVASNSLRIIGPRPAKILLWDW